MSQSADGEGLNSRTKIVMLGTGTPAPDPDRSGPSTAIIVDDTPYLVDFGPGVIRRAAAAHRNGVSAFGSGVVNVTTAFLTHMHADHTLGYPDLILTPWIMGRNKPLNVYGPPGLRAMTDSIFSAWSIDIENRVHGSEGNKPDGLQVNVSEITPGTIYTDDKVKVIAFPVSHGEMENAFGFRFETVDKVIVVSGDTSPVKSLEQFGQGCDVLIHEAYSQFTYERATRHWQDYRRKHHTSSRELAALANKLRPGLLVLHHRANPGGGILLPNPEDELLNEIKALYDGPVVTGHDLDVFL